MTPREPFIGLPDGERQLQSHLAIRRAGGHNLPRKDIAPVRQLVNVECQPGIGQWLTDAVTMSALMRAFGMADWST